MRLDQDLETTGVFELDGKTFSGKLILSPERNPKIVLTGGVFDFGDLMTRKPVPTFSGIVRDSSRKVTFFGGVVFLSHLATAGIVEYTIEARLMLASPPTVPEGSDSIENLHLICPDFSNYLGNSLIEARFLLEEKVAELRVPYSKTVSSHASIDGKVSLETFNNIDKYSLQAKFSVEQVNVLVTEFEKPISLYAVPKYVRSVETFFTFLLQQPCTINEIVTKVKTDNIVPAREISTHVYFPRPSEDLRKLDDSKVLVSRVDLSRHVGRLFSNWAMLTRKVPYLDYFFHNYFQTRYLEQRIVAQVNLLEILHKYFYGTKKKDAEVQSQIDRIVSRIEDEEDRGFVERLIREKSGFGLKRKLAEVCARDETIVIQKSTIELAAKIRSTLSHGDLALDVSRETYLDTNAKLHDVICRVVFQEIEGATA